MEIETDSAVSEDQIEAATRFGIQSSDLTDAKKYIIAFLKRLLLHQEKIYKNLFEDHLNPMIGNSWQEVLSSLEDTNRKLLNIQSGSLIFTLFCPENNALMQLEDTRWKTELQKKMDKLLNALGLSWIDSVLKTMKIATDHRIATISTSN